MPFNTIYMRFAFCSEKYLTNQSQNSINATKCCQKKRQSLNIIKTMKFPGVVSYLVATVTLSLSPMTMGASIDTCEKQFECLDFSINKEENPTVCSDGDGLCEYIICITLDLDNPDCIKDDAVSHTCVKPDNVCQPPAGFGDKSVKEKKDIKDGYTQCQVVPPGGVAEFLIKDGNARSMCGDYQGWEDGGFVECETFSGQSCTGKGTNGKECVWKITAPSRGEGGCDGDPHIQLWNRTRFDYHGECDLVLLDNKDFADGLGMNIHLRTTQEPYADIPAFYSFIESAAIRIGDDILEFEGVNFWINGVQGSDSDLPTTVGGEFLLHYPTFTEDGQAKHYLIDLHGDDYVLVYNYMQFMSVVVNGGPEDFGNSVGLMGHYHTGKMLARDGRSILSNEDEYGSEWQVHDHEPKLFRSLREPQHPRASCKVPENVAETHRHLRMDAEFVEAAEAACAHKASHHFDSCVFDVLATHDLGMANAWGF
jgi:hypothetical protein